VHVRLLPGLCDRALPGTAEAERKRSGDGELLPEQHQLDPGRVGVDVLCGRPLDHLERADDQPDVAYRGPQRSAGLDAARNGACACIEFIMPAYFWLAASYRGRSPEIQQTLNDLGWLPFDGFVWTIIWQNAVIGIVVLLDKRTAPIFPRWYGYLSIWCAFLYLPAGFNVFFKDGPLAWNGAVSWWVLLTAIFGWLMTTTYLLLQATKRQELEAASGMTPGDPVGDLERRLAELEKRLENAQVARV